MAIRIQLRRDTAANWVSSNPVLRQGEIGIETDTLQMKLGDGTSTWIQIAGYMNLVPDGNLTIGDYVMVNDIGAAEGVVGLDINKNAVVTGSSIILEGSTNNAYETTLTVTDPTADRTITFKNADGTVAFVTDIPSTTDALSEGSTNKYFTDERAQDAVANSLAAGTHTNITVTYNDAANSLSLAAAPGYVDEQAVDAVAAALAAGTHTNISVSYDDAGNSISLTGAQTYNDENAQDAIGNNLGTGLSYNDTTGAISVDTSTIQARVTNITDTEIGYLDGVTSAIQTQLNDKLASATASTTYAPIASPTFTGTVAGITKSMVGLANVDNTTDAGKPVSTATQTELDLKAPIASPTFTGTVTLPGAPSSALHAATKAYVDNIATGLNFHPAVHFATSTNITTDYNNGTDGLGATLTAMANGAIGTIDGHQAVLGDRALVKAQTDAKQNGIYYVSSIGGASSKWVLTRALDSDNSPTGEIANGDFCFVQNGTLAGGYGFIVNTVGAITIGTTDITYTQFNSGQSVVAGNGLSEPSAGTIAIDTTITADLSTAQTLTNKTINANANTITVTSANVSDFNEAAQDAIGTILGTGLSYNDAGPGIGVDNAALTTYLLDGVSGNSYGLIGTSVYLDVKNTNGYNKEIELDIAAVKTQLNTDGYLTTSSTSTLTNKTLTSPKINEDVALTATATELNYVDGVTSAIQTQIDTKVSKNGGDTITNASASNVGLIVKGASSQSSNLQEWQNSAGLTLANIASTGTIKSGAFSSPTDLGSYVNFNSTSGAMLVGLRSASDIGMIIKGTTSQSADLQQWQNVGGTTLGKIDASGNITAPSLTLSTTALATTSGGTGLTSYTTGDIIYSSASNTLAKLAAGSNGQILTLDAGVPTWAAAPITLPTQTGNSGKYLTTDGSSATWGTLVVPISTGTVTVNQNTAQDVDTTALSTFTSIEYMVSIKQGSKVRTSKVILQTDGTSVDMTEFAITETGGTISGVVVSATTASSNGKLQVTVTDALSTNATVKFSKVAL